MSFDVFIITLEQVLHSKDSSTYHAPYVFVPHDDSVCVVVRTPVQTVHVYIENSKCPYIIAVWPNTLEHFFLFRMGAVEVFAEVRGFSRLDNFWTQLTLKRTR